MTIIDESFVIKLVKFLENALTDKDKFIVKYTACETIHKEANVVIELDKTYSIYFRKSETLLMEIRCVSRNKDYFTTHIILYQGGRLLDSPIFDVQGHMLNFFANYETSANPFSLMTFKTVLSINTNF
jgi:hypothetical protein